jgi:hypothetical protein
VADFSKIRVELRRHVGYMHTAEFGLMPVEHPQKYVLYYLPEAAPGESNIRHAGYLADVEGARVCWFPHIREKAEQVRGLVEHIEGEAYRLKDAGEFVDPPEA